MSKVDKRISPEITSEARDETQYYNISNFDISTDIVFVTMPTKLCTRLQFCIVPLFFIDQHMKSFSRIVNNSTDMQTLTSGK